jgi:hypothetical protein
MNAGVGMMVIDGGQLIISPLMMLLLDVRGLIIGVIRTKFGS